MYSGTSDRRGNWAYSGTKTTGGVAAAVIGLSNSSIAEDAAAGANVGTLSVLNATGTPVFSLTDTAGNRFAIDGTALERGATALDYEAFQSHSITLSVSGMTPSPPDRTVTINVKVTLAALTLSANTIEENSAPGAAVGSLVSVTSGSALSLANDVGGRFALSGSNVIAGLVSTDYETATSHNITVRETNADGINSPRDTVLAITVTDVDDVAPTITSANTANNVEGIVLAHALTANESVTWSITGGADQARFEISGSTLRWASNGVKDFDNPNDADTNNTYVIQITATDTALNATNQTITITVTDLDEIAPTITSASTVNNIEGVLLAHALTANEAVTWTITGGADQARFELSGSTLRWASNGVKDFENPNDVGANNTYVVQLTATDTALNASNQTITVTVTDTFEDVTAPTITSSATANNVENVVLAHALTANESVTWTITGGADQARFEISGSTLRWASNGVKDFEAPDDSGTNNTYIVQITATDPGLNASNQTITITVTNADEVAPTITSSNAINLVENIELSHSLTANEAVTWTKTGGADTALFTLTGSTLSMTAKDFDIPVDAGGNNTYVVQVTATDTALNATNQTITVTVSDADETAPTITSASTANNAENTVLAHALTANESVTWSITGGADQTWFELSGSTLRWISNSVRDFEEPDDAGANNTYVIQITATDTALNATNQTITITVTDVVGESVFTYYILGF